MNKLKLILFLSLIASAPVLGQLNRYAVFLNDKNGTTYSIDDPEAFLSERAINKREQFNIKIDYDDLPVSQTYIQSLSNYDLKLLFTSKWLNAAVVEASDDVINEVQSEDFVKKIKLIAPGSITNSRMPAPIEIERRSTKELNTKERMDIHVATLQNEMLGVDVMHEDGYMGEDMLVAVFDSGFEEVNVSSYFSHLFDNNQIYASRDFIKKSDNVYQYDSHGSKVLSTMAAYKSDDFEGVIPNAEYVLCVTEDIRSEHNIEEYNWLMAAEYADSLGVDVISSSVAYSYFDDPSESYTYEDMDGNTAVVSRAASMAAARGIIVVASVGNEGNKSWTYLNAPSDADSVLGIGAVDDDVIKTSFSSFGPAADGRIKPDLVALGSNVSVINGENISISNGTSFSTPLVAGLVTGFWQAFPELSPWEVTSYLRSTASNAEAPDTLIGFGLPNYQSAARMILATEEDVIKEFTVYPNPTTGKRIFAASAGMLDIGKVEINFFNLKGQHIKRVEDQVFSKYDTIDIDITSLKPGYYFLTFNTERKTIKSKLIVR